MHITIPYMGENPIIMAGEYDNPDSEYDDILLDDHIISSNKSILKVCIDPTLHCNFQIIVDDFVSLKSASYEHLHQTSLRIDSGCFSIYDDVFNHPLLVVQTYSSIINLSVVYEENQEKGFQHINFYLSSQEVDIKTLKIDTKYSMPSTNSLKEELIRMYATANDHDKAVLMHNLQKYLS